MSLVGSLPRVASLAMAVVLKASLPFLKDWLKPSAPSPASPCEYSLRKTWRSSRVSDCSAASTSPNWTGAAVWLTGIGSSPLFSTGAEGEPGLMSTKKLPSRNTRGRILSVASSWMGSPASLISISTRAPPLLLPGTIAVTFLTLPTSTPAMRTGELGLRLLAVSKTPVSLYGFAKGLAFVKPMYVATTIRMTAISPALKREMPWWDGCLRLRRKMLIAACPRPGGC